jgi:hypothetical protein
MRITRSTNNKRTLTMFYTTVRADESRVYGKHISSEDVNKYCEIDHGMNALGERKQLKK